jgi:dihydrofolate reductase
MDKSKKINLIIACTFNGGIGYDNKLSWNISEDLKKFKKITSDINDKSKKNAIIMGRNTWESLPFKPLPGRVNIIISKNKNYIQETENVKCFNNIINVLEYCNKDANIETIYVIGGSILYNCFLENDILLSKISRIYLSVVYGIDYNINKYIAIDKIYKNFIICKDYNYKKENNDKKFASYVCYSKKLLL